MGSIQNLTPAVAAQTGARTGEVSYFIPDPFDANNGPYAGSSGGEGVVADKDGVIYSAEVGPRSVKRYVRFEN